MSHIQVQRGIAEPWQFQFSGTDITGMTVEFYIKKNKSDTDANSLYSDTFTTHSDAANGLTASQNESAAHTAAMPRGIHWYEARLFNASGVPIDNIIGQVEYTDTVIDKTSL